jgi:hypothetical protein
MLALGADVERLADLGEGTVCNQARVVVTSDDIDRA